MKSSNPNQPRAAGEAAHAHRYVIHVHKLDGSFVLPGEAWSCYVASANGPKWEPATLLTKAADFGFDHDAERVAAELNKAHADLSFRVSYPSRYAYDGESN